MSFDASLNPFRSNGRAARVAGWLALPAGLVVTLFAVGSRSGPTPAPAPPASKADSFEQDGFRVRMSVKPNRGKVAEDGSVPAWTHSEIRFDVTEAGDDGRPMSGLEPLAWILSRSEGAPFPDREACRRQVQTMLGSRVIAANDVNLNEYLVVTLDDNPSVSIIDPQVESSKTKVIGLVSLQTKGADFVLADDRRTLFVTLPDSHGVAAVNLSKKVAAHVDVGGEPLRIAFAPDRRLMWVGDRKGSAVTAVDAAARSVVGRIEAMPGPHELACSEDSRHVYVSSANSTRLAVVDARDMKVARWLDLEAGVAAVAYSPHARRAYAALETGAVVVVDGETLERVAKIELPDGSSGFAMSPDGRWGFVLNGPRDQVTIVDTATNRPAYTILTEKGPDRIDFTDTFAYVRHSGSAKMVLIDLGSIGEANVPVTSTVVLGRKPPTEGGLETAAPLLAPLPEGGGALVLNPADRVFYHFVEGMNAPMGEYSSYPWTARGIVIVDRTLQEVEKGAYASEFQTPRPGSYTVPFLIPSSPQIYGCFDLTVKGNEEADPDLVPITMEALFAESTFPPNATSKISFRLTDTATKEPLTGIEDVLVVVVRGPTYQWRGGATPKDDGLYEVDVPFRSEGRYAVLVHCESRKVRAGKIPARFAVVAPTGESTSDGQTQSAATRQRS